MFLKKCEIKNFRSIKDLNIEIDIPFRVLVGFNESGKSNILKALALIDPENMPSKDDLRDISYDESPIEEAYVRFVFGLEKKDTDEVLSESKKLFQAKNYNQTLLLNGSKTYSLPQFCENRKEGLYKVDLLEINKYYSYWNLSTGYTVHKEWKKVPVNWPQYVKFPTKDFKFISISDYPEFKDDPALKDPTPFEINQAVGGAIKDLIAENHFDSVVWTYDEKCLLPGKIDIATFKSNVDVCIPLRNVFNLAGFHDIPDAITTAESKKNGMQNLLRRLSESTTSHLRKVWPEYKNIKFELTQNGTFFEAGILDEYNVYSLDRRSDGFKRFIAFLLMISARVKAEYLKNTLIIMDEPEIGLHPSGIQFLRNELNKIANNNIVFVATHSIFMIDKDRIDRHIIIKKEKEETKVISDYSSDMLDEEVIYKALGYSLFDVIKPTNIIFEGWSDKFTFSKWLKSAPKPIQAKWKEIGFVHAIGAKDVNRVANNLENLNRKYIVLSDADNPSRQWQSKFDGKYPWFTYFDLGFRDKQTIEDFLNEKYVIDVINEVIKKEQIGHAIDFPQPSLFNEKINTISRLFTIDKDNFERIKRIIKNKIFENLTITKINLDELVEKLNTKLGL